METWHHALSPLSTPTLLRSFTPLSTLLPSHILLYLLLGSVQLQWLTWRTGRLTDCHYYSSYITLTSPSLTSTVFYPTWGSSELAPSLNTCMCYKIVAQINFNIRFYVYELTSLMEVWSWYLDSQTKLLKLKYYSAAFPFQSLVLAEQCCQCQLFVSLFVDSIMENLLTWMSWRLVQDASSATAISSVINMQSFYDQYKLEDWFLEALSPLPHKYGGVIRVIFCKTTHTLTSL